MSDAKPNSSSKSFLETLGEAVPVLVLISAIGGMALTPLYIMATTNSEAIKEIKSKLEEHVALPSHPVILSRVDSEVKRLDVRIEDSSRMASGAAGELSTLRSEFLAESARTNSQFVEIETQIDSMSQSLNIQFSNGQRQMQDFQNAFHEMGATMPIAPISPYYFPNISNRAAHK